MLGCGSHPPRRRLRSTPPSPYLRNTATGATRRAGKKAKRKTLEHLNMDRYPFAGHHADEAASVIRKTLGVNSSKATMPKDDPGVVSGDALAKVLAWADAFDRTRAVSR